MDSDDDNLASVKQILTSSKRAKRVIDLTGDDDDDGEEGDGDFTEVSWFRTTPNGSTSGETNSTLPDRPHLGRRPTPFPLHRLPC